MPDLESIVAGSSGLADVDAASLAECIEVCQRTVATCTACADACLDEPELARFRRCVRLNLDCADICDSVARVLSRKSEPELSALRALLEAGTSICGATAAEALKHADTHAHCRTTAEICQACARGCDSALTMLCAVPSA